VGVCVCVCVCLFVCVCVCVRVCACVCLLYIMLAGLKLPPQEPPLCSVSTTVSIICQIYAINSELRGMLDLYH